MPVSGLTYYKKRLAGWKESPCPPGQECPYIMPGLTPEQNTNKPNISASVKGSVPGRSVPVRDPNFPQTTNWYPTCRPLNHHRRNYTTSRVASTISLDYPGSTIFRRMDGCSDENTCGSSFIGFYLAKDGADKTCTTTDLESGKNSCFAKSAKQKVSGGDTDKALAFNKTSTYSVSSEGYIYSRGKSYSQLEVPVTPETDLAYQYDTPYLYNILCPSGAVQNDRRSPHRFFLL